VARLLAGIVLLGGATLPATAQEWTPTRPLRIIAPFAPGGTADILARQLAQSLTQSLGQSVVVENRSGGNTVIATEALIRAAPDGYTLGIISTPFYVTAALMKSLPYNPAEVQPLTLLGRISLVLVTHPSVKADTPRDLVALGQAAPLNMGSGGNGTASHLAGALFKLRTNLAVTGSKRSSALPDVPTMAESGFPDFDLYESFGLVLPPNTPPEVGQRLGREVAKFVRSPEMQKKADALGLELVDQSPAEYKQTIDAEMKRIGDIVRGAKIEIE